MPPKLKKSKEDRLAQQKLCKRRRYAQVKNDPELLAIAKEKRRAKYLRDKEAKKIKNISEKTPRSQREQRKKWRENSKRYRESKKVDIHPPTFEAIQVVAGPSSEDSTFAPHEIEDPLRQYKQDMRAAVKKVRYTELKKRKNLMRIIAAYNKRDKARCKQIQRLKKLLKEKTLLKPEEVLTELQESHAHTEDFNASQCLKERVRQFFLDDTNSVMAAGKKEYIRRNHIRMQKRYLSLPLKNLYQKFQMETNIKISYSFFCKLRPFWIVFRKKTDRDTCLCSIHLNMDLLTEGLNKASIITEKNSEELLATMCCDKRNINCLQRNCESCKSKDIKYMKKDLKVTTPITFYEWKKVTKEILKDETKKKQVLTQKVKITTTTKEALQKFKKDLPKFFDHNYKITSQYKTIRNLKENLNFQEACIHVDFSENYALKYATEVQSFHFGGSRQQVSLHTAVIYTHNFSTGQVGATSMCTISDCLRHDAPAVWGHLVPLIEETIKLNPFIDTLHFLSDSPTSQYRNKYIFYIIGELYKDFPQLNRITWNYSEAGHGKGAPDGVGATLKRTADRMVMYGEDVGTFKQFYKLINKYIENKDLKVIVKKVELEDILQKVNLIPTNLQPFKGTFSVYQVLWDRSNPKTTLRRMSCFECDPLRICEHGKHLGYLLQKENIPCDMTGPDVVPLGTNKSFKNENKRVTILTDITIKEANV